MWTTLRLLILVVIGFASGFWADGLQKIMHDPDANTVWASLPFTVLVISLGWFIKTLVKED